MKFFIARAPVAEWFECSDYFLLNTKNISRIVHNKILYFTSLIVGASNL